jgi:hypothetical protein
MNWQKEEEGISLTYQQQQQKAENKQQTLEESKAILAHANGGTICEGKATNWKG